MKYLISFFVIIILFSIKPSIFSGTDQVSEHINDTLSTYFNYSDDPVLFPANQVITNSDSEHETTQRFDRMIQSFMRKWELKGSSFALMKDNKLIYSKGYGFADTENGEAMDVMHVFRIASISKLITAVAVMKLVEDGRLSLNDKVFGAQGILNEPMFQNIKDSRSKNITVEHLLRHQGGYSTTYGDPMFCSLDVARKMNVSPPADLNTMIRFVLERRLRFVPGQSTSYSNIGYGILSKVIEKASGQSYESYIRKQILLPAGCFDMHLGKNKYEEKLPNEVKYYEVSNAGMVYACDGSGELVLKSNGGNNIEELYGAGGWVASPAELLRFLSVIDGDPGIPDILSPASVKYMTSSVPGAFPIGWMDASSKGDWSRTGTLAGTSALMKKQSNGYSWVFLTNTSSWKGSKFPKYIENAVKHAMNTVTEWPEHDLFEMQRFDHEKLLVIR